MSDKTVSHEDVKKSVLTGTSCGVRDDWTMTYKEAREMKRNAEVEAISGAVKACRYSVGDALDLLEEVRERLLEAPVE